MSYAQQRAAKQAKQRSQRAPVQLMVDEKYGSAEKIMALPPAALVRILQDPSGSVYAKAKACMRLAVVGDKTAVPAMAALLAHAQLSAYARFGLEPMRDPSADDALRAALDKVQGILLVGVVNSIGIRKDKRALARLEKLRHDPDTEVARAADAAMAGIRPPL